MAAAKKVWTPQEMGRVGGLKRGRVLSSARRKEIAALASKVRWAKQRGKQK